MPAGEPQKDSSESQQVNQRNSGVSKHSERQRGKSRPAAWSICPRRLSDGQQHFKGKRCGKGQTAQDQSYGYREQEVLITRLAGQGLGIFP